MGFDTVNKLARKYKLEFLKNKFQAVYAMGEIENEKVIIAKPQTYMNLSGESIIKIKNFYKIQENNIVVIYDDMDLPIGEIRIRKHGSAGSHNGMKSIIQNLDTEEFPRIRIGIGSPSNKKDAIDYVIGRIPKEEILQLDKSTDKALEAVSEILKNGIDIAMNKFN